MWINPLTVPLDIFLFSSRCIELCRLFFYLLWFFKVWQFLSLCQFTLEDFGADYCVKYPSMHFFQPKDSELATNQIYRHGETKQAAATPEKTVTWKCEKFLELFSCFDLQTSHIITRRYSCYNSKRFNGYNMKRFNSLL